MSDAIDMALVDAVYPNIRGTMDGRLRTEAIRRARKVRAALAVAGYEIVPALPTPSEKDKDDGR